LLTALLDALYYIARRYSFSFCGHLQMAKDLSPNDFLPLTPAMFHILLALADRERHGYDIMREVDERTEGQVRMGPGTLYGSIKRMLSDGLIEELDERPDPELDDERRRYYRLTDFGHRVAVAEAERLARLVKSARIKKLLTTRSLQTTNDI
jgi:DNA-binding PadR family transcriptional regulator